MTQPSTIQQVAPLVAAAEHIVVFTGAGMSAESGIPTFRDDDGFWQRFPVEQFATWRGIMRTATLRPAALIEFAHQVIGPIAAASPNAGHLAIEQLEHLTQVTVVTQNIDALHQEAGNTTVLEIHGSLFEIVTRQGRFKRLLSRRELQTIADKVLRCKRWPLKLPRFLAAIRPWLGAGMRGIHRPNLVLFGDAMAQPAWDMARAAAKRCDLMIQVGCSGVVMPAAMLPVEARTAGAAVVSIDPHEAGGDYWLQGQAARILPSLVAAARE